jgi:hypothetical protein
MCLVGFARVVYTTAKLRSSNISDMANTKQRNKKLSREVVERQLQHKNTVRVAQTVKIKNTLCEKDT